MPVTAGHVPGVTSGLRRVPTDPRRFRNGRWFLLAEGVLVSAFGIAGLVSAALHPYAGPTGAPVLGLASTPAHSAILLAFGVAAIAAVGNRRAAVTVTALSAVAYVVLLFSGSVASVRGMPTPLGFHASGIVLHGVLAVVNLALLMWFIPDELGDEAWVPRRPRGRRRDPQQPRVHEVAAPARGQPSQPGSTNPPVSVPPARRALLEQSRSQETNEPSADNVENSSPVKHLVPVVLAVLAAVVGIVIWIRHH
jgi:hypothetical protein